MILFGLAILLVAISGVPGLSRRKDRAGVPAVLLGLGALAGLACAAGVLWSGVPLQLALPASPLGSLGHLRLDALGAFFLVPVLLLPACGSVYALAYWGEHREHARRLRLLYGVTTAFLVLLVAADHALTFLLAWEGMAATAFFLVITEDREPATLRAAWLYLATTHVGTLCLFGAFALLAEHTGTFTFGALPPAFAASPRGTATFLLFLAGFGLKAGVMPLHFWLPPAHAAAPSHVSSFMSGIFIKMGILGLVRFLLWVPLAPLWWGALLVVLGAVSGILGVAAALGQHDLKRLLAYHSVENIGIILLGLGLGLLGRSLGQPAMAALGFAGALLHVLNHSLFKGLLFLGAGAIIHATGLRDLDHMGGLARAMPFTSGAFLTGAWAICGLPPLNGFVSEWLIYLAAFRGLTLGHSAWSALSLGVLALIGALAAACFAKVYGVVFLGQSRSAHASGAREVPRAMLAPMGLLAGACVLLGLAPVLVAPALARVVQGLAAAPAPPDLAALGHLAILSCLALPLLLLAWLLWRWGRMAPGTQAGVPTWDCGYTAAGPRVQYTASSFGDGLVSSLSWVLLPRYHWPRVRGLFPQPQRYRSTLPDPVLDRLAAPGLAMTARALGFLRFFQSGHLHLYLLYILLTLVALLLWMVA
jgi:formate hydrogenlyase subunit 3/multisubunit Na+/H+ antiporter MnhD subunit